MINLHDAVPTDRPHLLLQSGPDDFRLRQVCIANNAEYISYRDDLLARISGTERFLVLDRNIDRELDAVRTICAKLQGRVIVLDGLDVVITYLRARSPMFEKIFVHRLLNMRQLDGVLWLALPAALVPEDWPTLRLKCLE
jgi:hypothetical protein